MSVFHSVRTRIIILSVLLFASFIAAYTFTVWTVANGYALVDSSQNRSFSLNLVVSEMEEMLDNVDALITRISIDNELKAALSYGDMRDYYDSFSAMIQANPAFGIIERFIATDRSYSDFLQVGSTSYFFGSWSLLCAVSWTAAETVCTSLMPSRMAIRCCSEEK